jgi:ferredoxin
MPWTRSSRARTSARSRRARRWPSRSRSSSPSSRSRARSRSRATGSPRCPPRCATRATSSTRSRTARPRRRRIEALPAVHLRGDRLLRPAPPGHRVRHDAADARARAQPGAGYRSVTENRFTGTTTTTSATTQPRLHPARAVALHRLRPVRPGLQGGRRRRVLRLHAHRLRHAGHHAARHEPERHAVRVSCGRCAETCPTGALMPKPRVLQKYDVDESRCILCGICVDACPYDALR